MLFPWYYPQASRIHSSRQVLKNIKELLSPSVGGCFYLKLGTKYSSFFLQQTVEINHYYIVLNKWEQGWLCIGLHWFCSKKCVLLYLENNLFISMTVSCLAQDQSHTVYINLKVQKERTKKSVLQ